MTPTSDIRTGFSCLTLISSICLVLSLFLGFAEAAVAEEDLNPIDPGQEQPAIQPALPPHPSAAALEELGRKLFFDTGLSAGHNMSCASCHDPKYAYGPPNKRAAQPGGAGLSRQGARAAPSLRYLSRVPLFREHYFDEDVDESVDAGPTGGFTWDGRAFSVHEQARLPLLSKVEMANQNPGQVAHAIQKAAYSEEFRQVFGDGVFQDPEKAFAAACQALEVFQQTPREFYPYNSKYDAFLRGQIHLTRQELRGLELFSDPGKGNCASCHPSAIGRNHALPTFSDFGFIALGVPRNQKINLNRDPGYYDLGLCGPYRQDLQDRQEYCGRFRTPSLRNVALRSVFFHNGAIRSLEDAVRFYAERDSRPENWYPRDKHGKIAKFNDLPEKYWQNVNFEPPFHQEPSRKPELSKQEIRDIVAFLKTLTDGWHYKP